MKRTISVALLTVLLSAASESKAALSGEARGGPLATDLSIGTGQSSDTAAETNDHERQTESEAARIAEVAQLRSGATPPAPRTTEADRDRSFRPDYSRALSVGQMEAAWQREIERLFPSLMAGVG
jgi:hypothetical protein